jgi:hypothetical protein
MANVLFLLLKNQVGLRTFEQQDREIPAYRIEVLTWSQLSDWSL